MNTEQLEHELREALAARADALPATAGSRLRTHDYRPRTRSLRPPVAAGALTAAAVAGAAVWVVGLSSQTSSAFAGWSASPTAGSPGQVNGAEAACRTRLIQGPAKAAPPGGAAASLSARGPKPGALSRMNARLEPVLTDTRGPFTWVIFAGRHGSASCISGPSFTAMSANGSSTPQAVQASRIQLSSLSQAQTPSGSSYSFVEGRAGSDVTAAALVLDDGTHVQATLQNGWFVAWWPGDRTVRSALVTTPTGTATQTIPAHAQGCPTPPKANGPGSMCMSGTVARGGHAGSGRHVMRSNVRIGSAGVVRRPGAKAGAGSRTTRSGGS
ncbi:MAG TPA: hypothetical protein VFW09_10680 [Solirubrobacteraceae bacterium]|nr:hypothetical protein [Solirubrobacteraceae bacterium]